MPEFDKKQIELLKGSYALIGRLVGCTREYVVKVLHGQVGNRRGGKKAALVTQKAKELLAVVAPAEK